MQMSARLIRLTSRLAVSVLVATLSACQTPPVGRGSAASGQPGQAAPVVAKSTPAGQREAQIDAVYVEIGLGSPVPVNAVVTGFWPNACAQLAEFRHRVQKPTFLLVLKTTSVPGEACPDDPLPFRMSIPLNLTGFSAGTYTVNVNGAQAIFEFPVPFRQDATIEQVEIRVATSARSQVNATVRGCFQDACLRMDSVAQARDGNTFRLIPLFLHTSGNACTQTITPFAHTVILDTSGLSTGTYQAVVNDVSVAIGSGGTYTVLMVPVGASFELAKL